MYSMGQGVPYKNMYFFARGQICRTDRRESLHDGRALAHTCVYLLLVHGDIVRGLQTGGGAKCFLAICLQRSFGDSRHKFTVPFMSGHRLLRPCTRRRRLTCDKLSHAVQMVIRREHSACSDRPDRRELRFFHIPVHTCIRCRH